MQRSLESFDEDWNAQLAQMNGHFLQSTGWACFQQQLGRVVVRDDGDGWMWQAVLMPVAVFSYLYVPYGPQANNLAPAIDSLKKVADDKNIDFVRLEPHGSSKLPGSLRPVKPVQPQHTQVIDLGRDIESLRADLASGHRNAINGADRRGLSFRSSSKPTDIELFLKLLTATTARAGFKPHPDDYYRTMAKVLMPRGEARLYLASAEGRVIAAAIVFDWNAVRYYAHAAASAEARQYQAAVPLVWKMILDAKEAGMKRLDLNGVAPTDNQDHPWAGFTRFKKAFGGQTVSFAGTFELPVNNLKYLMFRLAKQVKR
jgi:lipid II:glycine glycyltransferase (peptidoglycan interpeptide bridge formation enzyme)